MAKNDGKTVRNSKILKSNSGNKLELKQDQLRWTCPEKFFKFKSTLEVEPLNKIIGQPRAVESIRLGAELFSKGYNIFVTGLSGTGRLSTVKKVLEDVTTVKPVLFDYTYVNNFDDPDEPLLIKLDKGKGKEFAKSMKDTIAYLRRRLPKLFEEDNFKRTRRKIIEGYQQKEKEILDKFDKKIKPSGFIRGQLENEQGLIHPEVFPVIEGKPVQIDNINDFIGEGKLSEKQAESMRKKYLKFHNEIFELARVGLKLMQEFKQDMYDNDKAAVSIVLNSVTDQIKDTFKNEKVTIYIDSVKNYILDNIHIFVIDPNPLEVIQESSQEKVSEENFNVFNVNVILDNSNTSSAPIVVETAPTYTNLFGTIERTFDASGYWKTDFSKIKAGSILKADQGYLIVNAQDMFQEAGVWQSLKRVLLYDKLEIQPYEAVFQLSQLHLKPEPIDVKVKVIIIGGQTLYYWLWTYEKGFKKIFKVNAQFDYETDRTNEMMSFMVQFVSKICNDDQLPHCSPDGMAAIMEWAVEHAGTQKRITLKFSDVADLVRESAFYDGRRKSHKRLITREDVKQAIECRRHRNNLLDEKMRNQILDGTMLIDTDGKRIGQINGLTILDTGLFMFGKPARITATVSAGDSGIINIEREVDMSGSIHSKGVLILTGFLREKFGSDKPMNLSASIAFEQNYGGIDGDSATAAEIYSLLSAITKIPIKQSFAITGSVNQKGDIQPIGGVNDKIRGFYEICKERGLTGEHSVIIPNQNVKDLMLSDEIVEAVGKNKFHIYSIMKIEDGVKLLMDIEPGILQNDGSYTKGSLYAKVADRLEELRDLKKNKSKKSLSKETTKSAKLKSKSLKEIIKSEES